MVRVIMNTMMMVSGTSSKALLPTDDGNNGDENDGNACSKALLPTKSNPASIKEGAEVFPPCWCVEALQTSSFCYSASVGIGIIVLQIILLE